MRNARSLIAICLTAILFFSCKKTENNYTKVDIEQSKADAIAARYGLTKTAFKPASKATRSFKTVEEFESFLKKRRKQISDSAVLSTAVHAIRNKTKGSSNQDKLMNAEAYGDIIDPNQLVVTYSFPGFTGAYPDKVMVVNASPYDHWLIYTGFNFGSWSYTAVPGRVILMDGFRYTGVYTETYTIILYSYTRVWNFTMDVLNYSYGTHVYAKYEEI